MKRRKDRYAVLEREVMPWGEYAGKRISKLSVNYCNHVLRTIDHLNPYLRDLLKLRLDKETNWLKELKKDRDYYESMAEEYEAEMLRYKAQVEAHEAFINEQEVEASASDLEKYLRLLRRRFAARYHPDASEGSAQVMAMINRIFNELETEVRLSGPKR